MQQAACADKTGMGVSSLSSMGGFSQGLFIAASGLNDAQVRMDVSANNIANENTDAFIPSRDASIALSNGGVMPDIQPAVSSSSATGAEADDGLSMLLAKTQFEASARALKMQQESDRTLFDIPA